jgi:hypothetical protein
VNKIHVKLFYNHCLPWVNAHFSDELHSNART